MILKRNVNFSKNRLPIFVIPNQERIIQSKQFKNIFEYDILHVLKLINQRTQNKVVQTKSRKRIVDKITGKIFIILGGLFRLLFISHKER